MRVYGIPVQWTTSYGDALAAPWAICLVDGRVLAPRLYPPEWFSPDPGPNHFILWLPYWQGSADWFDDPLAYANGQQDCRYGLGSVAAAFSGAYLLPESGHGELLPEYLRVIVGCALKLMPNHECIALARLRPGDGLRALEGRIGEWRQVRTATGLESGTVPDGASIDAAIGDERAFLAKLAALGGAGLIRGQGYERAARVTMTEGDRLQRAFDQLFDLQEGGSSVPRLSGIREAYVAATGDTLLSGVSDPARLREADTTTASFSYLLGTSMNKRLLNDYQAWPSEWQKFCTTAPIRDFKQQDRIRLGAFGSLSTVAEDAAYTTISLSDTRATYTPAKRGNLVAVTRETIVNDDMYAIKQIPGMLAVSAAFTLAEFVYTLLAANGAVIYDTFKLFDSINHANTGVVGANLGTPGSGAALSSAALQAAVTKMRRQTNLASKPIGLKPRYLVVPPELEWQAMVVTKSAGSPGNNYNDINPMLGYCEVLVAPQLASPGYWLAVADPRVIDTIELGFVGGQINPQLFIQDQPLFGNNFTNDVITYKVRHEYGGAVVDYRGFYLGNN